MPLSSNQQDALAIERHELALRASNEGIWDWDLQRGHLYYSRRILEFLSFEEGEYPNPFDAPEGVVHPEDIDEFRATLAQFLSLPHDTTLAVEARLMRSDSSWCWMRIRGVAVRDSKGEPVRIAGSMIDITRRKTAESALEEERHLFRLLIENVPENIYFKDLGSNFVVANSATAIKLGAENERVLIGTSDEDYFDSVHASRSREDEVRIMESGEPILSNLERETWTEREDTWVVTTKLPWYDRKGRLEGTFGITSDVTQLIQTREKLERTAAALEMRNRAYEEEIQLAREIQGALIPDTFPPAIGGGHRLATSHRFIPSSDLGGDHLDVFPIDEHRHAILICDVMGHGIRSALVASMLRGLIEDQSRHLGDPSAFVVAINEGFQNILLRAEVTLFATMSVAVIDLAAGEISHVTAGHHPPLLISADGRVEEIPSSRNPALGLIPGADFEAKSCPFEAGSSLFFYTDGLTEANRPDGEEWGRQRLVSFLREVYATTRDREATCSALVEALSDFQEDTHFDDDVCFLLADYSKESGPG